MKITGRAAIYVAFGVGPLLLAAGCGGSGEEGARQTLVEIQPSNYVEVAPATTTTTTTTVAPAGGGSAGEIAQGEQVYVIKAGDSLSKIASLYDITLEQLINYNGFSGPGQLIVPGDEIKIPPQSLIPESGGGSTETAGGSDTDPEPDSESTAEEATGEGCTHTIAAGEFPNRVARQYDITYEELQAANPAMDMTTTFVVGDTLVIPPNGNC
jgi:LysM repeat protein